MTRLHRPLRMIVFFPIVYTLNGRRTPEGIQWAFAHIGSGGRGTFVACRSQLQSTYEKTLLPELACTARDGTRILVHEDGRSWKCPIHTTDPMRIPPGFVCFSQTGKLLWVV